MMFFFHLIQCMWDIQEWVQWIKLPLKYQQRSSPAVSPSLDPGYPQNLSRQTQHMLLVKLVEGSLCHRGLPFRSLAIRISKKKLMQYLGCTLTTSIPCWDSFVEAGLEVSLVTARISNWFAVTGSPKIERITEPPWFPVAPNTTSSFFKAMVLFLFRLWSWWLEMYERMIHQKSLNWWTTCQILRTWIYTYTHTDSLNIIWTGKTLLT